MRTPGRRLRRVVGHARRSVGASEVRDDSRAASDALWPAWAERLASSAPITTVFDVGANRGQTIKWFRPLFPRASIHAFEPFPAAYEDLCVATRDDPLVRPVPLALGAEAATSCLHENSTDSTNSLLPNSPQTVLYTPAHMCIPQGTIEVEVDRLDDYCTRQGINTIDVLKLDVQGYELRVLEGAGAMLNPSTIRSVYLELLFVEYYEDQCWSDEVMAHLRDHGYRLFGFCGVSYDEEQGWRWADAMFIGTEDRVDQHDDHRPPPGGS